MESTDTTPWYNKYVGLPYRHLGNDPKTGIDCVNLCRYIYKQELGLDVKLGSYDFCNIVDEDWYNKTHIDSFGIAMSLESPEMNWTWELVDHPQPFDIIILSIGSTNVTNHCAIYVDHNKMLQTMIKRDSWVTFYGSHYKDCTQGIYRWKNLQS